MNYLINASAWEPLGNLTGNAHRFNPARVGATHNEGGAESDSAPPALSYRFADAKLVTSWPFWSLRPLRPLNTLLSVWSIHLYLAGIVSPLLAMLTGHLIGSIEPSEFTTRIRLAVIPPIGLPVLAPILLSIDPSILAATFLPYIAQLRHTNIIPTASPTVFIRSAAHRPWATIERTGPSVIHSRQISALRTRLTDRRDTSQE
jgi:hypothetical protein